MSPLTFDHEGHLVLGKAGVYELLQTSAEDLMDHVLMVGTPRVFRIYADYCAFKRRVSDRLRIHPSAVYVRGSAALGYSLCPKPDKLWRDFDGDKRKKSDIDLAVVDLDLFMALNRACTDWEQHMGSPSPNDDYGWQWAKRLSNRVHGYVDDMLLPPSTCMQYRRDIGDILSQDMPWSERKVTCFVFKTLDALRDRVRFDLQAVCEGLNDGTLLPPDEVLFLGAE